MPLRIEYKELHLICLPLQFYKVKAFKKDVDAFKTYWSSEIHEIVEFFQDSHHLRKIIFWQPLSHYSFVFWILVNKVSNN